MTQDTPQPSGPAAPPDPLAALKAIWQLTGLRATTLARLRVDYRFSLGSQHDN